ncbi:MAG: phosphate/phosphite/phosphonate ABC transporter substrate-binding protein [Myxococcales bacterium]|nr:phosphate/phosphite/phosphonate ABC transporter substrate-binding protein [Myxococcales bacterium]
MAVVFGVGPVAMSASQAAALVEFERMFGRLLNLEVKVQQLKCYDELLDAMAEDQVDFAWLPPAVYVESSNRCDLTLIASGVRARDAGFRGALFVRADSPYHSLDDLRGTRVGWVDPMSAAGYLFPLLELRQRGFSLEEFTDQRFCGDHKSVAELVARREVDVGATFVTAASQHAGSELSRAGWTLAGSMEAMRPLVITPMIPADTICAAPHVPRPLREAVSEALTEMHRQDRGGDVLMNFFWVEQFEPTLPRRYDSIRAAMAKAV